MGRPSIKTQKQLHELALSGDYARIMHADIGNGLRLVVADAQNKPFAKNEVLAFEAAICAAEMRA